MRINLFAQGGALSLGTFTSVGGTMTGPLILTGTASSLLAAVNKAYVDNLATTIDTSNITTGTFPANVLPAFNGDVTNTAGSNSFTMNAIATPGTYIKPTVNDKGLIIGGGVLADSDIATVDWSKINIGRPTTLLGYGIGDSISLSGDSSILDLTLHADPIDPSHASTKQYIDNVLNQVAALYPGDTIEKAYTTTPTGFLKCNGAILSKTAYANLYNAIGDAYNNYMQPGSGKPWKQQYMINDLQDGDITGWIIDTSLPEPLGASQAIVTKNRVYLLGGRNDSTYFSIVRSAPINADGTLGTWVTDTNSLPGPLYASQAIVTKNRVYLLGGSNGSSHISTVYIASINADGTLGTWVTDTNSLPGPLTYSQAIVTKNRVYLLGGNTDTVYTAPINADGTLGTWTTDSLLPSFMTTSQAIVTKNRVYLIGDYNVSNPRDIVYTAPINADGTLGTWTTDTSLPVAMYSHQAITTKNKVYLLGGYNQNGGILEIYSAPINVDGTLGTWKISGNINQIQPHSQVIITSTKCYLLGNWSGDIVQSAPISGGLNDYSPYYDGTYVPLDASSFMIPDTTNADSKISLTTYIKY
jgi:hypothetical protein